MRSVVVRGWILYVCVRGVKTLDSTWVGHHNDDAVRAVSDDLGDDVLEDVDVSLDEVQPALSLLLTDSSCHHHDAGVRRHRVV